MRVLFSILFSLSILYAQGIDSLLQEYEEASELSKKTKSESAGNLIIYTRDDLERMQVETLKDVLKSLRFFPYIENRMAQPDTLNQDPIGYYSKSVRVYLNENELLTAVTGSGLILFGNMEMDFIDHIEIYEGFPSFDFGVEPATIVIRLYSKTAEHDEGGRVKTTLGSYGHNKENIYYTNKEDSFSYFVYANRSDDKTKEYEHKEETLKRNKQTNRFYGSLEGENHRLEFHAQQIIGDFFLGPLVGNVPKSASGKSSFINFATHSKFLNDSLTLNLSYIKTQNDFSLKYNPLTPILIPSIGFINSLDRTLEEEAFTTTLKKEWCLDIHTVSVGIQYRYKHFDLTDVEFNIPTPPKNQAYSREDIYSFFLQDLIALGDTHLISLSVMDQIYKRDGSVNDPNTLQLRAGYIYSEKEWVAKTFLSRQEFASEAYMSLASQYGNPQLDSEIYTSIFQEISYETKTTLSKVILGYGVNENTPILDKNFKMQNSDTDIVGYSAGVEFTLFFNQKDKLELQANYTSIESPYGNSNLNHYNYTARMLNSIWKFDIFNELVIHDNYSGVSTGYDYSAAVKYAVSKDFHLNLKGDNIFNSGQKHIYVNQINLVTGSPSDTIEVPVVEQRFMFGMEYLF
ncbi:MAG: hypothetical protein J7L21_05180 [Sulfurimonas sp.]|nr:hypothetical protein [Sulfurimonas sp.]